MQTQDQAQLMTQADILVLANQLAEKIKEQTAEQYQALMQELKEIKEANKKEHPPTLLNARDVSEELEITVLQARKLIALPNFPKNIYGTRGVYKTGPWRYEEVFRFFKINKSKV